MQSHGKPIQIKMYLRLPKIDNIHTAFLFFKKDKNFYFGKDFRLLNAKPVGEFYSVQDKIQVPPSIPCGLYSLYFTFRIPKSDFRYKVIEENGKIGKKDCILIKKILIR